MTLGEKIKNARIKKGMTQSELSGKKITRNMLSAIESGKAKPSVDTIQYLAQALSLPAAYFLSEDDDLHFYEKKMIITDVYRAYKAKNYKACIRKIKTVSVLDDELYYLLSKSHLELAKISISRGELTSANDFLLKSEEYAKNTALDTAHLTPLIKMYKCITENVYSPLLNFDTSYFDSQTTHAYDYEMFKYLTQDLDFPFARKEFLHHIEAKKLLKKHLYSDAIRSLLLAIEASKSGEYNAFVLFTLYTDIENCYKQVYDFENAYIYSSKRLSLIEGFKS